MKKIGYLAILSLAAFSTAFANHDLVSDIPEIGIHERLHFEEIRDVAQYGGGDWNGVVGIARGISRSEAMQIAKDNSEITFFFYVKGYQMVLGDLKGEYRLFRHGDAVFFKGKPWWGDATGLADGYVKK